MLVSNVGQVGMGLAGGLGGKAVALAMAGVSPAFVTLLLLKVCGSFFGVGRVSCLNQVLTVVGHRFREFHSVRTSTTRGMETERIIRIGRRIRQCSFRNSKLVASWCVEIDSGGAGVSFKGVGR